MADTPEPAAKREQHPVTKKLAEAFMKGLAEESADPQKWDERAFADSMRPTKPTEAPDK
jgi:hypothetical protein